MKVKELGHCLAAACAGTQETSAVLQALVLHAQKSEPLTSISRINSVSGLQFDSENTKFCWTT